MTDRAPDRAAVVRILILGGVTLLALFTATSWSLPRWSGWRGRERMELVIASFRNGGGTLVDDALPPAADELRFAGTVPRPCHLFVWALTSAGVERRMWTGAVEDPGAPVGPGEFRLGGGYGFDPRPGTSVRFWAVCGPADLRYADLVEAARREFELAGGGAEGLAAADQIAGLPEGALQTSRLVRFEY